MTSDGKWDFKCPQFVDFNDVDKFDPEAESYFDKNIDDRHFCPRVRRKSTVLQEINNKIKIEFANTENESNSPGARKRSVYAFTAAFSKPKTPPAEHKNKENPFIVHHAKNEKKSFKPSIAMSKPSKTFKRLPPVCRPSFRTGVPSNVGRHIAIVKPLAKPENKPSTSSNALPPERRRVPSPPPTLPVRRKTTRPQTPQCLKRSMNKTSAKVIKTSEQIELERIAEMRRKMKTDLNINKATMKKTRAPALKPLPEKKEKPVVLPKVETRKIVPAHHQDKKNEAIFKKPTMMMKAKSFIGLGTHARQALVRQNTNPHVLRSTDRRATRSDSSTPSTLKLNASTSKSSSALKSLSACHSGVMFIPKQDQRAFGALKLKPSGQENKANKTLSSATPRKKPDIKSKSHGSAFFRRPSTISKVINTSQPFKDRTNALSTSYRKAAVPQKPALKRMSSDALIRGQGDKRIKITK